MRATTRYSMPPRQAAVFIIPIFRVAVIVCTAMLVLTPAFCSAAEDLSPDAPYPHDNSALTMDDAMEMAESSSPSVASAKRALELALLQLQAADAKGRPSVIVHAAPLRIETGLAGTGNMDGEGNESTAEIEKSISLLSQAGGEVRIPLGGGSLSLSANTSLPLSEPLAPDKNRWSANANLSVPIFGTKNEAEYSTKSAQSQVRRARFQLDQAIRQARASAQTTYFSVLAAQDRVAAADRALSRARDHAAFVEGSRSLGNASELDAAGATASVARARASAESANHSLTLASMRLNQAIGRGFEAPVYLAPAGEYIEWPGNMGLEACVQTALDARPEILMAEQNVTEATAALAQAIAAKRPDVFLQGQASSGGNWCVGLEISALLTRDYSAEIAIESAKDRVEQSKTDLVEARNSVILEVVEAFYNLRDAEASIELAHSTVAIATATLEVKEEQCRIGAVSYAEVSEAIEAVRKAESDLASQLAACFVAKSRLSASVGQNSF